MGVDGSITGGSCEVLSLSVGNVLSVPLDVSLGESEVDEEDLVTGLVESDAEVVRLDVSVDEVPVVDVLDPGHHLVDQHEDCLEGELSESVLEETFEGGSHQVHHEDVVVAWIPRGVP